MRRQTKPEAARPSGQGLGPTARARALLREKGLKVTGPRVSVLRALLSGRRPLSAHDILALPLGRGLDHVTVYRILDALVSNGIAHPVSTTDGIRRFEVQADAGCQSGHPHVQCRRCGGLDCLEAGSLLAPSLPARLADYRIEGVRLYLFGICPQCQREECGGESRGPTKRTS